MKKYNIIYADPPWQYKNKSLNKGGAERHYRTTSTQELFKIDVQSVCDENCILFMWVTFPKLQEGLDLIKAWGFEYKTIGFNWVKRNKKTPSWFWGMGSWTRSNSEICLIGVKGKPERFSASVHSVIDESVMRHSKKPAVVRDKIVELAGDLPRLEMFARENADGWDCFGDESTGGIQINVKGEL